MDTPQPETAGETVAPADPMDAAALAFKQSLGQVDTRPRDESGRFASTREPEEQIEAADEGEIAPEPVAESHEEPEATEEAAEEAQPADVPLPTSWPAEQAETWKALPPETRAFIAEREGQRDAATNAKFQEAANARRAAEAQIAEAQANRQRAIHAADVALQLLQPAKPPASMLDYNSSDYDPDGYHLANARYDQQLQLVNHIAAQRQDLAAQEQQQAAQMEMQRYTQIHQASAPAFVRDVPDVADQAKAPAILKGLMEYAVSQGAPEDMFQTPTTALEWHVLWKAREFDRLQEAKGRVQSEPRPAPKAGPAVRPGVATPRAAVEQAKIAKDLSRLDREGSVEAGAAIWKHAMKGMK